MLENAWPTYRKNSSKLEYDLTSWDFYIPGCHGPQIRQNLSFIFSWVESLHILTFKSCPCASQLSLHLFTFSSSEEVNMSAGMVYWYEIIVQHFQFVADICFLLLAQSQTPFSRKSFFFFLWVLLLPLPLLRSWLGVLLSWPLCSCLPVTLEKELVNNRQR